MVTDTIYANVFMSANVVSIVASVGDTIESIGQLCSIQGDHDIMKRVQDISKHPSSDYCDEEENKSDSSFQEGEEDVMNESSEERSEEENKSESIFASSNEFSLTSKDYLFRISTLPLICHTTIDKYFLNDTSEMESLQEIVASDIAKRMIDNKIPLTELSSTGYPDNIIELVRQMIGGYGKKRVI